MGGTDAFSAIPTAQVLPHSAYQIFGQMDWHRSQDSGKLQSVFPWVTGARVGLFGKGEFGVQVGNQISVEGKMQFIQEEDWLPAFSFGARQVFNSQEAQLYSVPDSLRDPYAGDLYLTLSKTYFGATNLNAGVSVVPGIDSGKASVFWGLSQGVGAGMSLVYDGFYRHEFVHHNLGLAWNFRDAFRISAGATEVSRYFYQSSQFGFYVRDREHLEPGAYGAPGVWLMVSLTGFMSEGMAPTTQARLDAVEKRLESQAKRGDKLVERTDRMELQVQSMRGTATDSVSLKERTAERIIGELVKGLRNETWDPRQARKLQDSLLALGEVSARMMVRIIQRESSSDDYRITCFRIMGASKNPRYVPDLADALSIDDPDLQREVVIALAKISTPDAIEALRSFRAKAIPDLQKLLDEILQTVPAAPAMPVPPAPSPSLAPAPTLAPVPAPAPSPAAATPPVPAASASPASGPTAPASQVPANSAH